MASTDDPFESRILASLAGAGSLLTELRAVMECPVESASAGDIVAWIVEGNVAAKRTQSGRVEVLKKLRRRYGLDPASPRFAAFTSAWRAATDGAQQGLLAYLLYGTHDGFVRMASCEWLAPRLRQTAMLLPREEVDRYIDALAHREPDVEGWGPATRLSVAQHYLTAVRDYGLASGTVRKRSVKPLVGPVVTHYCATLALLEGLSPRDALTSDWFRMLGLDLPQVVDALYKMAGEGLGKFRVEGQVVELQLNDLRAGR